MPGEPAWLAPEVVQLLMRGARITLLLTAVTSMSAFGLGVVIAWMRISELGILRLSGRAYIEIFRNVPALVGIIFWAYAFPNAFSIEVRSAIFYDNRAMAWLSDLTGMSIPYYAIGAAIGLILNTSAYIAELLRSGMRSLPDENMEAARSLGASPTFAFRHVLLPHAVRAVQPALITRLVHNLKNTSLASLVTVPEIMLTIQAAINRTFFAAELLALGGVIFLIFSWLFSLLLSLLLPGPIQPHPGPHRAPEPIHVHA